MFPIYAKLGGRDATLDALRAASRKRGWPSKPTAFAWEKNGELPARALYSLMRICDARRIRYTAEDFSFTPEAAK